MGRSPAIILGKNSFYYIWLRKLAISLLKFDLFNLSQNPMVPFCQQDPCQQISNNKSSGTRVSITAVLSITYRYTSNEVIYYMKAN